MKKRIVNCVLAAVLICMFTLAGANSAFAQEESDFVDPMGNAFSAGQNARIESTSLFAGYGAGYNVKMSGVYLANDAALAGYNVKLDDSDVEGSAYLAGYNVAVTESNVDGNVMAAGYSIHVDEGSSVKCLYASGEEVIFEGVADYVNLSGEKVIIRGLVDGDAKITAKEIVIEDGAVIRGECNATASKEPVIPSSAHVGSFRFEQAVEEDEESVELGDVILSKLLTGLYLAVAMGLLSLLMSWLMKDSLNSAKDMLKERTAIMLGSGAITLIVTPIAIILACITVVGAPIGLITLILYALLLIVSITFTGASLGRMVFGKMNAMLASLLGVVILEFLIQIPFVGIVIGIGSAVYTFGYFIQALYLKRMKKVEPVVGITEVMEEYKEDFE